jgi:hypothetical protein
MHLQIAFATIFDTCSFMDSPESSVTPKIFILYFGAIVFLQDTKWFDSPQTLYHSLVPTCQPGEQLHISSATLGPVTQALYPSMKPMGLSLLLMRPYTRFAL